MKSAVELRREAWRCIDVAKTAPDKSERRRLMERAFELAQMVEAREAAQNDTDDVA